MKTGYARPARHWWLAVASAGLLTVTAVYGQTPPADTGGIEEVFVTAQKRSESLQTVPVSITALTSAQLQDIKIDSPSDLVSQIPNLQVNGIVGEASPVFSLRGISMFDYSLSQSSPVASYIDEVYKGNFVLFGVDMYDLERIEVLRGPQGTLYGKNTTGGAINFITHKPGFNTDGYLKVGVGNYSRQEAEGALQGALIDDKLAARVAFSYTKADGWFHNVLAGYPDLEGIDQYGVRASLLFKATDDLTATLRWSKSRQNPQNYGIYDIICRPNIDTGCAPGGVGGSYYRTSDGTATGVPLQDDQIGQNYTPKRRQENQAVALTVDWNLSEALALTSITSWDDGDLFNPEGTDGAPIYVFKIPYTGTNNQVTQDLRLTSRGSGPFNFIAGAYYQHEDIYNSTENQFFAGTDNNLDGTVDYQDCVALPPRLRGLRVPQPVRPAAQQLGAVHGRQLCADRPAQAACRAALQPRQGHAEECLRPGARRRRRGDRQHHSPAPPPTCTRRRARTSPTSPGPAGPASTTRRPPTCCCTPTTAAATARAPSMPSSSSHRANSTASNPRRWIPSKAASSPPG